MQTNFQLKTEKKFIFVEYILNFILIYSFEEKKRMEHLRCGIRCSIDDIAVLISCLKHTNVCFYSFTYLCLQTFFVASAAVAAAARSKYIKLVLKST